jgi:hypothetical protein
MKEHIHRPIANDSGITIRLAAYLTDAAENRRSMPGLNQGQEAVQQQSETLRAGRIKLLSMSDSTMRDSSRLECDWLSLMNEALCISEIWLQW